MVLTWFLYFVIVFFFFRGGGGGYLWVCNNVMRIFFLYIAASYTHVRLFFVFVYCLLPYICITFLNMLPKMLLSLKIEKCQNIVRHSEFV